MRELLELDAASNPSITGMLISRAMTSGSSRWAIATASPPSAGSSDHLDALLGREHGFECLREETVVVGDQQSNRRRLARFHGAPTLILPG